MKVRLLLDINNNLLLIKALKSYTKLFINEMMMNLVQTNCESEIPPLNCKQISGKDLRQFLCGRDGDEKKIITIKVNEWVFSSLPEKG